MTVELVQTINWMSGHPQGEHFLSNVAEMHGAAASRREEGEKTTARRWCFLEEVSQRHGTSLAFEHFNLVIRDRKLKVPFPNNNTKMITRPRRKEQLTAIPKLLEKALCSSPVVTHVETIKTSQARGHYGKQLWHSVLLPL